MSQLEESEAQVRGFAKAKQALSAQVEEARNLAEEEGRVKASLAQQLRNLSGDCEELKASLAEESGHKNELQKALSKANAEAQQWKV